MRKIEKQVEEYLIYCRDIRFMSIQTLHNKTWALNNFLDSIDVSEVELITNEDVDNWIKSQTIRGCSGQTVNCRVSDFVAMVRYFLDRGVMIPGLNLGLIKRIKGRPTERVFYSKEQIDKVLKDADLLEWLLISLCFDCGFRISELRNLRLKDIEGQRIRFIGKGSKNREVYMSEQTRQRLDEWIEQENVVDYLWVRSRSTNNQPLTVENLRILMKKQFERAGFNGFYPHALRHSFATNISNNGAPLPIIQQMMGHSNLVTTERYIHAFDNHLRDYFNQYKFAIA